MSKHFIHHNGGVYPVGTPLAGSPVPAINVADLRRKIYGGVSWWQWSPKFLPGETKIVEQGPEFERSIESGHLKTLEATGIFSVGEWAVERTAAEVADRIADMLVTSTTFFPDQAGAAALPLANFSAAANLVGFRAFMPDCATGIVAAPGTDILPNLVLDHFPALEALDLRERVNAAWNTIAVTNLNLEAVQAACLMSPAGAVVKAGHFWTGCSGFAGNDSSNSMLLADDAMRIALTGTDRLSRFPTDAVGLDLVAKATGMAQALFDGVPAAPLVNPVWDNTNNRVRLVTNYNDAAEWAPAPPAQAEFRMLANCSAVVAASLTSAPAATVAKINSALAYIETEWANIRLTRWNDAPWVAAAYAFGGDTAKLATLWNQIAADTTRYGTVASAYDMGKRFATWYCVTPAHRETWQPFTTAAIFSTFGHLLNVWAFACQKAFQVSGNLNWLWLFLGMLDAFLARFVDSANSRPMFDRNGFGTNTFYTDGYGYVPGLAWVGYAGAVAGDMIQLYL